MILDNQNFAALIDASCARHATRPALFHGGRTISYHQLAALVARWTAALRAQGAGPEGRVALWLPNSPAFVAAFLAALRTGAIAAPLGVLLAPPEVRARLAIAAAGVLVTTRPLAQHLGTLDGVRVLTADPATDEPDGTVREPPASPTSPGPAARAATDVAVLISTSGTTGKAKAAELTHGGIAWNATGLAEGLELGPRDVQLAVAPLSHVLGMTGVMNASLLSGAALALMERFDAPAALALMAETATTGVLGAPPMFAALLREARQPGQAGKPPRLRFGMAGGAALANSLTCGFEETFGCALRDGYGMSEVGGGITLTPVSERPRPHSVGPALPGSELRVVDLVTGAALAAGDRGEVAVRSPSVMRGYRGDEEGTRAAFDDDGWLLTGDIGYLDHDGHLFLVDRKKELIIRSGYNVYPREVEEVLLTYPGVLEAAVLGVADDQHGEEVVALVVPAPGGDVDPESLKQFARERLAAYKYPRRVFLVEMLPKGPTGKIAKRHIDRALFDTAAPRDARR
jgi:long-chain acyl-CoA synthetase